MVFILGVGYSYWACALSRDLFLPKLLCNEVEHVIYLGLFTALRVIILIALSSLIWVPIGIWIGLNPRISQLIQPLIQFLAAFPANLFFPIVTLLIVRYHLNVNIWTLAADDFGHAMVYFV